jgi:2,4-diaminopentanoate dehydrogenase
VSVMPRIAIYGTGQFGGMAARFALEKGWPIVAAYNRAGDKIGKDLGQVIGLGHDIGVVIEDCEIADFSSLEADIGLVFTTNLLKQNLPAYRRLLGAGANVLCHGSEAYHPFSSDQQTAAEIDALAKTNGVTFTGSGIWDMSRIWSGLLVIGPCTQIDSLVHRSITDAKGQAINPAQARQVGIGMSLAEFEQSGLPTSPLAISYTTVPALVLETAGFTVTNRSAHIEPITFSEDIDAEALGGMIKAGTCVGTRIVGHVQTAQGPDVRVEIELRLFREGEVEHMFWEVFGKPRTRIRIERDNPGHATVGNLFNRIPDVLAARPGVVTVAELGPLKSSALI